MGPPPVRLVYLSLSISQSHGATILVGRSAGSTYHGNIISPCRAPGFQFMGLEYSQDTVYDDPMYIKGRGEKRPAASKFPCGKRRFRILTYQTSNQQTQTPCFVWDNIDSSFTNRFPVRHGFSSFLYLYSSHIRKICLMSEHLRICVSYLDTTLYIMETDRVLGASEWFKIVYLLLSCHA